MKILIAIIILFIIYIIYIFNSIIRLKVRVRNAWADIDTQLKRRHDLIPNLIEVVKGYAGHERKTLEETTAARSNAIKAHTPNEASQAENSLRGALKTLFAVSENYPQLKANKNFLELQKTLTDIENSIQYARRYYNAVVRDFNTKIQVFPNNITAKIFNFKQAEFFQLESPDEGKGIDVVM